MLPLSAVGGETMESQLADSLVVAALSIVSGYVPYLAYKEITVISKVIGQYGSRNDMKLFTVRQIFKAQGGGIIFFFGCYIIAIGFASALFFENWKCYFSSFLLAGGIFTVIGIIIIFCVFFYNKTFNELIEKKHEKITKTYDKDGNLTENKEETERLLPKSCCDDKKQ